MPPPKRIAAIISTYQFRTHADVILRQIFDGYPPDGRERPQLKIVSMFTDQVSTNDRLPDLSRDMAKQHGFPICDTIADALTLGGKALAVDGVLSIFEHGHYPENTYGQKLYPRRKMFEAITDVFAATGQAVPVFNDKHLATKWDDAKWMVERARKMMVPFMAGSSLPVTYRRPDFTLPKNCELLGAVAIGYGHLEHYGFHAVEALQCVIEHRKGAVTGVKAVTTHMGPQMWQRIDRTPYAAAILDAAADAVTDHATSRIREGLRPASCLVEIEYRDGFRAFVLMCSGWIREGDGGAFTVAVQQKGEPKPAGTLFYLQSRGDQFPHFANLVRAIDTMMQTGHAPYPVERTLLTTGIVEMMLRSRHRLGERIETPHLDVSYKPANWPHGGGVPQWAIDAGLKK